MSEGCPSCFTSQKAMNESFQKVRIEAKKFAIDNQVSVAIYKEAFTFSYMEVNKAMELHYNILEFVSMYD
jgi:hypothetical protein